MRRQPWGRPGQEFRERHLGPKRSSLQKWQRALEQAGVEFLEPTEDGRGEGVDAKDAIPALEETGSEERSVPVKN